MLKIDKAPSLTYIWMTKLKEHKVPLIHFIFILAKPFSDPTLWKHLHLLILYSFYSDFSFDLSSICISLMQPNCNNHGSKLQIWIDKMLYPPTTG